MSYMLNGIDVLLQNPEKLLGSRVALLTNDAAKTMQGELTRKALLSAGIQIIKLFSPEHGLATKVPDGEPVANGIDVITRLPVISLYGQAFKPKADDVQDIDWVLFDIPDVGARFYTYLWSLSGLMEICFEQGKRLMVLDRANPLGGNLSLTEGPLLNTALCTSFLGRWPIPIRHCCTLGELALWAMHHYYPTLQLNVIGCLHWQRNQMAFGWKVPFTPTSPAIANPSTALMYAGSGLWEGININEGRGTNQPFTQMAAPWMKATDVQIQFLKAILPNNITFQTISTIPNWGMYSNEMCYGIAFEITDATTFQPVTTNVAIIRWLFECFPEQVAPRNYCTAANPTGERHLDLLLGVPNVWQSFLNNIPFEIAIAKMWEAQMKPFLLYD